MNPIQHLPIVSSSFNYEYFGVEKEDYQLFNNLKYEILFDIEQKGKVSNHKIVKCFSLLHDIRLEEGLYYTKVIEDRLSVALTYFHKQRSYFFEATKYINPDTKDEYRKYNGFNDLLKYTVRLTIKKQRRNKKMSDTAWLLFINRTMKEWIVHNNQTHKFVKGQIWSIAGYIAKNFCDCFKGNDTLDQNSKIDMYLRAVNNLLGKNKSLSAQWYSEFTMPSGHLAK